MSVPHRVLQVRLENHCGSRGMGVYDRYMQGMPLSDGEKRLLATFMREYEQEGGELAPSERQLLEAMSRSDTLDAIYEGRSMYGPVEAYKESAEMRRRYSTWAQCGRKKTPTPPSLPVVPMHAETQETIIECIAASIKHARSLVRKAIEKRGDDTTTDRERVGYFVTDLRRAFHDFGWTHHDSLYVKLCQLCRPDIWKDIGEIHSQLLQLPVATDIQQLQYWLERANEMTETDGIDDVADRVSALQRSLPRFDSLIRQAREINEQTDALAGQIASVLDGDPPPASPTSTFVREQLRG